MIDPYKIAKHALLLLNISNRISIISLKTYCIFSANFAGGGGGGWGGGILDSPCPSVRPSVRPSVCRRHGFRSISQVCFRISI